MKSMRYRDTSKIVTFYTRRYGKIKCIAKGARQAKNKFGASLEPMTLASLVLYKKEERDLQLISECDIVQPYKRIHSEMERMSVAFSVLELINQVAHDEEENVPIFSLLVETFDTLEEVEKNFQNLFFAFELRMAALLGFAPTLQKCTECGKTLNFGDSALPFIFELNNGGMYCQNCALKLDGNVLRQRSTKRISALTAKILERLLHANLSSVPMLNDKAVTWNELDETLRLYLEYHVEELKPLKTRKVFRQMNI